MAGKKFEAEHPPFRIKAVIIFGKGAGCGIFQPDMRPFLSGGGKTRGDDYFPEEFVEIDNTS